MKRWLGGGKTPIVNSGASKSLTALDEPQALQEALAAAAHIMNDDVDLAESELSRGTSPFHKLGRATTVFLRATLGFEKSVIEQATKRISEAEESAFDHQKRAIRDPTTAHQSAIYPTGSEYALCHAETQLMGAVVAVLNESLTESLRGFYKLKKAFSTLYEISEAERRYVESKGISTSAGASKSSLETGSVTTGTTSMESSGVLTPEASKPADDEDSDLDFVDADEAHSAQPTPGEYQGHLDGFGFEKLGLQDQVIPAQGDNLLKPGTANAPSKEAASEADDDVDFRTISVDPVDLFIHSGVALCYGLLQLLLSIIPPSFAKLLSLFSFRGDRKNGLRLLWSATKFKENINGAMASLIVLGFHNGAVATCDIVSADALPEKRLRTLLAEMRQRYPKSKLWLLEEARMLSADHELAKAVDTMSTGDPSPMKQVEALRTFERSLNLMYLHRYQACADSFLKCIELNNWSHGLYYYIAGACHVELYRQATSADDSEGAQKHAKQAEDLLNTVPEHTGKKRFMARQLPFDIFITRKLAKWSARASERKCTFVEAVGVSPVAEMIYFWSGFKKMGEKQLLLSLDALAWSSDQEDFGNEPADERAMLALLRATCLRFLGRVAEAKTTLTEGAMAFDLATLRACPHPDTWPLPVGHYETAVCLWAEAGGESGNKAKLKSCSDELRKVETAEGYELEARVGLKVTTARETLRRCGVGP